MSFLTVSGVSKRYGAVTALDGVELSVPQGSRTAIVGPSGSGKTTLLRILAGFEVPDAGTVALGGEILADASRSLPAHLRNIGIVAQDGALFPHLNIADNIGFGIPHHDPERAGRIADVMTMVELDETMLGRRPDELSGGQQQRVALARALARRPRLMLLDEPFSALDTGLRLSTRKAVAKLLGAAGITTILVTHDQAEALSFADQVAVMRDGRLPQIGTPRQLYLRPHDKMIAEFLGDAIVLPAEAAGGWARCALGRVRIADGQIGGAIEIMLRPEQVLLQPILPNAQPGTDICVAEIVDIDFGGADCLLTLLPLTPGNIAMSPPTLTIRRGNVDGLGVGSRVEVTIVGEAHVFPDPKGLEPGNP